MQRNYVKFIKDLTGIACLPVLISSNTFELRAKYLPNKEKESFKTESLNAAQQKLLTFDLERSNNLLFADNGKKVNDDKNVLISEIIIEGWEEHPEGRKLELAAYDSMSIKPGSVINNQILKKDLNAIYASGWFWS